MEQTNTAQTLWRVWVDTRRRIVSFHEEFFSCMEQYTGLQYRYQ